MFLKLINTRKGECVKSKEQEQRTRAKNKSNENEVLTSKEDVTWRKVNEALPNICIEG